MNNSMASPELDRIRHRMDRPDLVEKVKRSPWGARAWTSPQRLRGASVQSGSVEVHDYELGGEDQGQNVVLLIPNIRANEDGTLFDLRAENMPKGLPVQMAIERGDWVEIGRAPRGNKKALRQLNDLATKTSVAFSNALVKAPSAMLEAATTEEDATQPVPTRADALRVEPRTSSAPLTSHLQQQLSQQQGRLDSLQNRYAEPDLQAVRQYAEGGSLDSGNELMDGMLLMALMAIAKRRELPNAVRAAVFETDRFQDGLDAQQGSVDSLTNLLTQLPQTARR